MRAFFSFIFFLLKQYLRLWVGDEWQYFVEFIWIYPVKRVTEAVCAALAKTNEFNMQHKTISEWKQLTFIFECPQHPAEINTNSQ